MSTSQEIMNLFEEKSRMVLKLKEENYDLKIEIERLNIEIKSLNRQVQSLIRKELVAKNETVS